MTNLNQRVVGALEFPRVDLREQKEIIRLVQSLFSLAATIEKRLAVATARVEKLPHTILGKAFSGQLVPTEAELARAEGRDYEPADALLERIRAEHNAVSHPRRQRRARSSLT
jgi:type I restriction enzyme S subunit